MFFLISHITSHKNCYKNLKPKKIRVSFDRSFELRIATNRNRYPMFRHTLSMFFYWMNEAGQAIHF